MFMMMEVVVDEFCMSIVVRILIMSLVIGLLRILLWENILLVVFLFSNWKVLFRKFNE